MPEYIGDTIPDTSQQDQPAAAPDVAPAPTPAPAAAAPALPSWQEYTGPSVAVPDDSTDQVSRAAQSQSEGEARQSDEDRQHPLDAMARDVGSFLKAGYFEKPLTAVPGQLEAVAAGAVGLGSAALSGVAGLTRGAIESVAPGGEGFSRGFEEGVKQGDGWTQPIQAVIDPQTDVGKKALKAINTVFTGAIQGTGDVFYNALIDSPYESVRALAPYFGANAQAGMTLLSLLAGRGRATERGVEPPTGAPQLEQRGPSGPNPVIEGEFTRVNEPQPEVGMAPREQLPPPQRPALPAPGDTRPVAEAAQTIPLGENNIVSEPTVLPADPYKGTQHEAKTADQIALDPNDPAGSIAAIAAAPVAPIEAAGPRRAPEGVDPTTHANAAGDMAGIMLHADNLARGIKLAPPAQRAAMTQQLTDLQTEATAHKAAYASVYGPDAANDMHQHAAETYHAVKGDYRGYVRPPAVQETPASTEREQPAEVNNAVPVSSAAGMGAHAGGDEGAGRPVEGGGVGQGQQGAQAAPARQDETLTGDRQLGNTQTIVPGTEPHIADMPVSNEHAGAPEHVPTSDVDRAASEVNPNPTQGQVVNPSGYSNYKMGHILLTNASADNSIETRSGGMRSDKSVPPKWQSRAVGVHIGYDRNAPKAADGDHLDTFTLDGTPSDWNGNPYIVDAINQKTGKFDEHKVIFGADSEAAARKAYTNQYPEGWKVGKISKTTMQGYKTWKRFGDLTKPFAPRVLTKEEAANPGRVKGKDTTPAQVMFSLNGLPPIHAAVSAANPRVGVSDIRPQAHILLDPLPKERVDLFNQSPLDLKEVPIVAGAIKNAIDLGRPPASLKKLSNVYTYDAEPGELGEYTSTGGKTGIGIARWVMDGALAGSEPHIQTLRSNFMGHEPTHMGDIQFHNGKWVVMSGESPLFKVDVSSAGKRVAVGPVITELYNAWKNAPAGSPLKRYLDYPFARWDRLPGDVSQDMFIQSEAYAQAGGLWYHNRAALADFPATSKLLQGIHDEQSAIDPRHNDKWQAVLSDRAVQKHLQVDTANLAHPGIFPESKGRTVTGAGSEDEAAGKSGNLLEGTSDDSGRGGAHEQRGSVVQPDSASGQRPLVKSSASNAVKYRDENLNPLGKSPTVLDIARHFDAEFIKKHGRVGDINNPLDVHRATTQAAREFAYQLKQARTGLEWYKGDIKDAFDITQTIIPELAHPENRQLLSIVAAVMSPQSKAEPNWDEGATATHEFFKTGTIPEMKGNGTHWGTYGAVEPIRHLNAMIEEMGVQGTVEWMLSEHTKGELNAMRRKYGVYRSDGDILGKSSDMKLGVEMFGPKVGIFALNLNGISIKVTVDTWAVRMIRRLFGQMMSGWKPSKDGLKEQSPTTQERLTATDIITKIADLTGYEPSQVQAVLWYFEQGLYTQLGAASPSRSFADGARRFAERESIPDGSENATRGSSSVEAATHTGQVQEASPTDFQRDLGAALRKPGWAILNADRAGQSAADNAAANERLVADLDKQGLEHQRLKDGSYEGVSEGGHLIFGGDPMALAKKYGQDSILTNKGLEYTDGSIQPAEHEGTLVGPEARDREYYSTLPNGQSFSMSLGGRTPPDIAVKGNGDRASVTDSNELRGDGRGFTDFFSAASRGERAPNGQTYSPVHDISHAKSFSDEYVKHRGNFDDHIATSIPGFREVQQAVGHAIVQSYRDGAHVLDIAASEGAFNKAITAQSGGKIKTTALDPNETMAKHFAEHSTVPGAEYDVSAFSSAEDQGKPQWTEDSGTIINGFVPKVKYDVVHESMGFQFISNARNAQFARVKELMKPDGIALFEEKVKEDTPQWRANEAQKDAYKARYFTPEAMKAKAAEVLEKGQAAVDEADSQKEQATVGMNDLMTTPHELETALKNNWAHVAQYWDAGNFKGYVASDRPAALHKFLGNLGDLNSEFSTKQTPSTVAEHAAAPDFPPVKGYSMYGDLSKQEKPKGSLLDSIKKVVAPASRGDIAHQEANIIRENWAAHAQDMAQLGKFALPYAKEMHALTRQEQLSFINNHERGRQQATPALQSISDWLRELNAKDVADVQATGTGKLATWDENHLGRIWVQPAKAASFFASRPIEGGKGFLKKRTFDYFADGINAGFEPVTYNPVEMALLKHAEVQRYVYGQKIIQEMERSGLAQLFKFEADRQPGDPRPPADWVRINDKIAMRGSAGQLWAPEQAATVINNHLMPGLQGNGIYDAIRWTNNAMNSLQLGLSAFHIGFTTVETMISKAALGAQQVSRGILNAAPGELIRGVGTLSQAVNPAQPVMNIIKGDKLLKAYLNWDGDVANAPPLVQAIIRGGGRVQPDDFYRNGAVNAFMQALRRNDIMGSAKSFLPFVLDKVAHPIFGYIVPRQKLGIFVDMAQDWMRRNPNATVEERRSEYGKIWDSVDNRMGQMVYDNLFMNRMFKDVLMVASRSPGWNLGTYREIGGGVLDLKDIVKDRELSRRTAYIIGLTFIAGVLGGIMTYLYTGRPPKDLKGYYVVKTGLKNPDGSDAAVLPPTYMKDVFAYSKDIEGWAKYGDNPLGTVGNKMSPALALAQHLLRGTDFREAAIRSPGDPWQQQLLDEAKFLVREVTPLSISNYQNQQRLKGERATPLGYLTNPAMIGVTPAPSHLTKTPEMAQSAALSQLKDPLIKKFTQEIMDGADAGAVARKAINAGLKPAEVHEIIKRGNETQYVNKNPRALHQF